MKPVSLNFIGNRQNYPQSIAKRALNLSTLGSVSIETSLFVIWRLTMSAAVSATKDVPFNAQLEEDLTNKGTNNKVVGEADRVPYNEDAEGTESEAEEDPKLELDLGPQFSLKEQIEKDKVTFFLQMFLHCPELLFICLLVSNCH